MMKIESQAHKAKAKRQRDNWKRRALLANDLLVRWLEWARMHGHLEHAEGIVKNSRELLANAGGEGREPCEINSTDMFGVSVARVDGFRSQPTVNTDEDMVRVVLDMPKSTWRKLKAIIPPNKEILRNEG